jgi:hypothetical protein
MRVLLPYPELRLHNWKEKNKTKHDNVPKNQGASEVVASGIPF